ncbi:YbfB/YjiJ family MFS transporter [Dongshaea marina]|uniref:YbfB/YjiJ family MFS transporter n=1 Tax=Dongshaea marina TaxID=2047966 RepID=UPI001900D683|nr:YbfB/YjiJ family MFS transporter [Dongshaea marina]
MVRDIQKMKVVAAGICSLILSIGIARFSYTPMLSVMQHQAGLGQSAGAWLASVNYVGYLVGTLITASVKTLRLKDTLYRWGVLLALLSTAAMAMTTDLWLWSIVRFLSGVGSAAGMLMGSGLVLNWLVSHQKGKELGVHFSGIGLGIVLAAVVVELARRQLNWQQLWYGYSLLGCILLYPALAWLPKPVEQVNRPLKAPISTSRPGQRFIQVLMMGYFCAGVGYVVSATFIVAIINQLPGMGGQGNLVFILIGLSAAPACMMWDRAARRYGQLNALIWAFLLQCLGILLPVMDSGVLSVLVSAVLFGNTFMGIVSLVLTMVGQFYPENPGKMMGKMTISYGIAQILAPLGIAAMTSYQLPYRDGLYLAGGIMVIGTVLMGMLKFVASDPSQAPGMASYQPFS